MGCTEMCRTAILGAAFLRNTREKARSSHFSVTFAPLAFDIIRCFKKAAAAVTGAF